MALPNILLIQADQLRADCLGCSGHPHVRTPHLDGLADQGVRFSHAFCPSPVCVPSRNSLLFGCWPASHGVIANLGTEAEKHPRPDLVPFSAALAAAGYHLSVVGKWGIDRYLQPADVGFSTYVPAGDYHAWRRQQGLPDSPRDGGWFGQSDAAITPEQSALAWGADQVITRLQQASASGMPFFVRWDTEEPHLPNVVPEPYASLYRAEDVEPWPSFGDSLAGKPYIQAQQQRTWGLVDWPWERWAPIVARYLGTVSLLDAQVGRVLAELDALGLAQTTLVAFTSDHGDLCGGHGLIDKHYVMYDDVWRVPLLVRWPGELEAGLVCEHWVTTGLDLAASFVAAAGAERPDSFEGHDLRAVAAGQVPRDAVFGTYGGAQFGLYSQRAVRERCLKYVWNPTAEDELYDLESDPGELENRATDPSLSRGLHRLRSQLVAWMAETHDPLLNGWTRDQLLQGRKV